MRCRRAAQEATAAAGEGGRGGGGAEGRAGAGGAERGGAEARVSGAGGGPAADRAKASAKVVARRDNGFAAAGSGGVKGAAARVLLAFLAAVSFRGMPGACAEGRAGAGGAERGGAEARVSGAGGGPAADRAKASAKVVARRDNGFAAAGSGGVKGAAARVLLAFLAAVSFRGMPGASLSANAGFIENSTLIAVTNGAAGAATTPEVDVTIEESTTVEQVADIWSALPDTATLTKGFSIPTYLPPFPEFIAADLPETTRTTTGLTMSQGTVPVGNGADTVSMPEFPNKEEQPQAPSQSQAQPNIRLHAYDSEKKAQQLRREKQLARERQLLPRRQLSLPPRNVTVQVGQHAYLPCQLHQHSSKPLSWVRLRDEHIIAVDHTTFINDARFAALLQSTSNASNNLLDTGNGSSSSSSLSWTLLIKYVQLQDKGWYECQLATEPKMSAKVQLLVITPKTELIGDKQRFVKAGSRVELHCIVRGTLEPPKYIVWYRGEQQVVPENEASGHENGWYTQIDRNIFGSTEHSRNTIGTLIIPVVRKTHSGNYTCEPENSPAVSLQLHVLSGDYSASAIMSRASAEQSYNVLHLWLIFLLVALTKT